MVIPVGIPQVAVYLTAANGTAAMKVKLTGSNSSGVQVDRSTTGTPIIRNQWNHILIGLKQSTSNMIIMVNGASEANSGPGPGSIIQTANGDSCVGASAESGGPGGDFFKGGIFHLWMDMGLNKYFDPVANIGKFYNGGKYVDEGANGQIPTGVSPLLFLRNPPSSFGVNSGTGPNHSIVGGPLGSRTPPQLYIP